MFVQWHTNVCSNICCPGSGSGSCSGAGSVQVQVRWKFKRRIDVLCS